MSTLLEEMDPVETPVVEFDFTGEITAIDSVVITAASINGRSASAAALLDGSPQIVGTTVLQRIKTAIGVDQVDYRLRCEATQGSDKRVRVGILPVRTA